MVDTQRFQIGPGLIQVVDQVATRVAARADGTISPMEVATYVPLDVDTVGRILESLEEEYALERIDREGMCLFRFNDESELREATAEPVDIERGEHLEDNPLFESNLAGLKSEEGWTRKVREQHELLRIAARSSGRTVELSHFTSRTDIPSSKIQSILNDFGAERYVESDVDEEADTLSYTFPAFDYSEERMERNLGILEELNGQEGTYRIWYVLGATTLVLVVLIFLIRFYL